MTSLKNTIRTNWLRCLGILIFLYVLWSVGLSNLASTTQEIYWPQVILALALTVPMLFLKCLRWSFLLSEMNLKYPLKHAIPAYLGSLFIGLLTPGRLGEFIKVVHVQKDLKSSQGIAWSSVLLDRIFDLCILLLVGSLGIVSLNGRIYSFEVIIVIFLLSGLSFGMFILINSVTFNILKSIGLYILKFNGRRSELDSDV